ncbi:MAG: NAD(P)-dependent oxidoreductase [Muribaculaceae bacterium]|nr:NAD(P)-dependent oxidoreductase [Muribaculaceae bacterium]
MEIRKIVIFGATGNVGSYLTLYAKDFFEKENIRLEKAESDVRYEIIASGRRRTTVFEEYDIPYISADLSRTEDIDRLPTENIFAVMLLSASIPSYMKQYDGRKYVESIILGGFNVLEYCRKCRANRILFTQTVFDQAEYSHSKILKGDDPQNFSYTGDHALYVIAKNSVLEMMEHYALEYGLKRFVFRLPTIYGYSPNHFYLKDGELRKRPVYQMIELAMKGEPLEIWGDPNYAKDMVHVYDLAQMMCKGVITDVDGGFYNVGTGKPVTLEEQVRTIAEVFAPEKGPSEIIYCPEKESNGGFLMDISNAAEDLGYSPLYDCRALFEDFKKEMRIQRFASLRASDTE